MRHFRARTHRLPDKGARVRSLLERVEKELDSRNEIDKAAEMFSDLNIVEKGLKKLTEMEWKGSGSATAEAVVDSDDDADERSVDPLRIIAQSRNIVKTVTISKPAASLITAADLEEIESFAKEAETEAAAGNESVSSTSSVHLEPRAVHICEQQKSAEKNKKVQFQPHKTTKTDVHSVAKEKKRPVRDNWESTAATPPAIRNIAVQMLSLRESIDIEQRHQEELKQLLERHAAERLEARKKLVEDNLSLLPPGSHLLDPNDFFDNTYRTSNANDSDEAYSENSYNGEELETGGVVVQYD